jgi:hypothetical protein
MRPYGMPSDHLDLEPFREAAQAHVLAVALHTFTAMPPLCPRRPRYLGQPVIAAVCDSSVVWYAQSGAPPVKVADPAAALGLSPETRDEDQLSAIRKPRIETEDLTS